MTIGAPCRLKLGVTPTSGGPWVGPVPYVQNKAMICVKVPLHEIHVRFSYSAVRAFQASLCHRGVKL